MTSYLAIVVKLRKHAALHLLIGKKALFRALLLICFLFAEPTPPKAPLILTSQQLAQLTQSGVLQLNNVASTNGMAKPIINQANQQAANSAPLVIKSEPNPLTLGATPTIQSVTHNVSHEDVSGAQSML